MESVIADGEKDSVGEIIGAFRFVV